MPSNPTSIVPQEALESYAEALEAARSCSENALCAQVLACVYGKRPREGEEGAATEEGGAPEGGSGGGDASPACSTTPAQLEL